METGLKTVEQEEARVARLFAVGKISTTVWDDMWSEWQDRRRTLLNALESLERHSEIHINNLDAALGIISKAGVLYSRLERSYQKELLRDMVKRVVVNDNGEIIEVKWLPPFSYLHDMSRKVGNVDSVSGTESKIDSITADSCTNDALLSRGYFIRFVNQGFDHFSTLCLSAPFAFAQQNIFGAPVERDYINLRLP